jgi:hypothetical protein
VSVAGFDLDEPIRVDRRTTVPRLWRWATLGVLLLFVAIALFSADQRSRDHEFNQLLDQVQRSQSTIDDADRQVSSMADASPPLSSASTPAAVRASLTIVQEAATEQIAEQVSGLQLHREVIAALRPFRWHPEQRRARDAYLAYLDDQITHLLSIAANPANLPQPSPQSHLQTTAQQALLKAKPNLWLG